MDISIVIPTYNRFDALLKTLDALKRIDYPPEKWEAIVVDDGSTDRTEEVFKNWLKSSEINVRYFRQENSGPARARNRGAKEAKGKYLIFIDNDILVESDFVKQHLESLESNPNCWILGRVTHPSQLRETPFGRYRDKIHESFNAGQSARNFSETDGMTGQNISVLREHFILLNGFDEEFSIASCEDLELAMRSKQRGMRVLYNREICVLHNDWAINLPAYCRRQMLYSISDVLLCQKYGESSPRLNLVKENAPVNRRNDSWKSILKKSFKSIFANPPGQKILESICFITEKVLPDSAISQKAYQTAIGVAIFRGVREGIKRYGKVNI
jgi:glycosyltransferase involved in cell wall biosynthesis